MTPTNDEFERTFWERDRVKLNLGLDECEFLFRNMFERDQNNKAVMLNYGICLFENGRFGEGEHLLGELCNNYEFPVADTNWFFEAIKFYTFCIRERDKSDALSAIFGRLALLNEPLKSELVCHAITSIADYRAFHCLWIYLCELDFIPNYSPEAMRKYYELASSVGRLDLAKSLFDNCVTPLQQFELNIIQLLYGFFEESASHSVNERWSNLYLLLRSKGVLEDKLSLNSFDAYRICLQLHQRLGPNKAEEEINWLATLSEDNFHCYWPLGALLEARGDIEGAIDAYHRAGSTEMKKLGQWTENYERVNLEKIKVSCIALSFNDAAMVELYCENIQTHCDEIIVNDGGSTDGTIELFEKFSREKNFPIHIIRDQQASFRDRNLFNKDGYRAAGLGGVKGFEADRRRTTTLMLAQYPYILLADLDDFFPKYPNLKSVLAGNFGVDHIAGSKREYIDDRRYCDLYQDARSAMPTLFRRDRLHVFSGVSEKDEYLANMGHDLSFFATIFMNTVITKAYGFWHLKWLFDSSGQAQVEGHLGVKYATDGIAGRPDAAAILAKARSKASTIDV